MKGTFARELLADRLSLKVGDLVDKKGERKGTVGVAIVSISDSSIATLADGDEAHLSRLRRFTHSDEQTERPAAARRRSPMTSEEKRLKKNAAERARKAKTKKVAITTDYLRWKAVKTGIVAAGGKLPKAGKGYRAKLLKLAKKFEISS